MAKLQSPDNFTALNQLLQHLAWDLLWLKIVVLVSNNVEQLHVSGVARHEVLSCSLYSKKLACSFRKSRLIVSMNGSDAERLHRELYAGMGPTKPRAAGQSAHNQHCPLIQSGL